jgi:protein associated with RNAse G/E
VYNINIRGIYATALVKFAIDNGLKIVNPTIKQKERFSIKENNFSEVDIYITCNYNDLNRVFLIGKSKPLKFFIEILRKNFFDLIIWKKEKILNQYIKMVPLKIREDIEFYEIEIPAISKKKLDEIRGSVIFTLPYHHSLRAGGQNISEMVSFIEKLVHEKLINGNTISKLFSENFNDMLPKINQLVRIQHVKLNGRIINLTPGKVIYRNGNKIILKRKFKSEGIYNGLGIKKNIGDYALTYISRENWFIHSKYYNFMNEIKGEYYSICTPIEIYENYIRYVDLGIDIVKIPNNPPRVIDIEEIEEAYKKEIISEWLKEKAHKEVEEILNTIQKI